MTGKNTARQNLLAKFDKRFVGASLAAAGAVAASEAANATIVSFNPVGGIAAPATTAGVYVDVETGASSNTSAGFTTATRPVLNIWGTSSMHVYWYPSSPATTVNRSVVSGANLANLAVNAVVGPASTYAASRTIFTAGAPWVSPGNFTGYTGFRFLNNAGTATCYGWMNITLNAYAGSAYAGAKINSWAYSCDEGQILVGAPEPTSLALLAAGGMGLLIRRRRVA